MFGDVSLIRSAAKNPATSPELTEDLVNSVKAKTTAVLALYAKLASSFPLSLLPIA